MKVNYSLQTIPYKKYYFLENDRAETPEILSKFQYVLENIYDLDFLGEIPVSYNSAELQQDAIIIAISNFNKYKNFDWFDRCIFFVLWDDVVWGKLDVFYHMCKMSLVNKDRSFSVDNFRNLIEARSRKVKNPHREIGPFYIKRLVPYKGLLNKLPMIFKKEANCYKGHFYGHSYGYARDIVLYDFHFAKKFAKVVSFLSDKSSKELFNLVVYGKAQEIWEHFFNSLESPPQYLDYIHLDEDSIILNCGVDSGAEIPAFLSMGCHTIYNIDPFGSEKLGKYTASWAKELTDKLKFIKVWLYESPDARENIRISTLKKVILEEEIERVDLIKVDIEGPERKMTGDLVEIMKEFRPQLALSIYHTQYEDKNKSPLTDLVDIPLAIMTKVEGYDFYINFYSYERWEIILYCIPK